MIFYDGIKCVHRIGTLWALQWYTVKKLKDTPIVTIYFNISERLKKKLKIQAPSSVKLINIIANNCTG